jgi:hypothetical protein
MSASAATSSAWIAPAEEGMHSFFQEKANLRRLERIAKEYMREAMHAKILMGREVIVHVTQPSADSLQQMTTPIVSTLTSTPE